MDDHPDLPLPPVFRGVPDDARATVMRHPIDIDYVLKAIVGIASPVLDVITSLQEQVEWRLRVSSLVAGLLGGLMSLVGVISKMRGKP